MQSSIKSTNVTNVANVTNVTNVANVTNVTNVANVTNVTNVANVTSVTNKNNSIENGDTFYDCLECLENDKKQTIGNIVRRIKGKFSRIRNYKPLPQLPSVMTPNIKPFKDPRNDCSRETQENIDKHDKIDKQGEIKEYTSVVYFVNYDDKDGELRIARIVSKKIVEKINLIKNHDMIKPIEGSEFTKIKEPKEENVPFNIFILNISKLAKIEHPILICGYILIKKILKINPGMVIDSYNQYRMTLISMMIATKLFQDIPYSNGYWARISGFLNLNDINTLEREFLMNLKFENLKITEEEYEEELIDFILDE